MANHNLIKDTEVAVRQCLQIINTTTKAVVSSWEKVLLIDGTILYYDKGTTTPTPPVTTSPTVNAGEALIECGAKDWEPQILCEYTPTSVFVDSFLRAYTLNADGTYTVIDTTLDGITVYTVTAGNSVKVCAEGQIVITPYAAESGTNGTPVTIPASAKSYSIVNLGKDGLGLVFEPIVLTGGASYTIPAQIQVHDVTVQEDQDTLPTTSIIVTPGANSQVFVSWTV